MHDEEKLRIRLYGSFSADWTDGRPVDVRSAKQRALLAILATAANGTHTRAWLQDTLWGRSGPELGRASLRRALSDLRVLFGDDFDALFEVSNLDIRIRTERIDGVGTPRDGEFLEGTDIPEEGFERWLREKRQCSENGMHVGLVPFDPRISPSIAVVPFIARSDGTDGRHFSDMLALEVTRTLSRSKMVDVISHLSSRQFEQRCLDMAEVRAALGINYLVYGTVDLVDGRFRIDADIADAKSGRVHWTRTYAGDVSGFLNGDHSVVAELSGHIGQTILSASIELARSRPLPEVDSHALLMSSIGFMHQHRLEAFSRARVQLEELIRRAPSHATLHAWLGKWYILSIAQGWSTNVVEDTSRAADCANRALDINPTCSFSLAIDGMIQSNCTRDFDVASARFREALEIDPNNALAWLLKSRLHAFVGQGTEAVECAGRACALSPIDPHRYFFDCLAATAHVVNDDLEEALFLAERSLKDNRRHVSTLKVKTVALELLGRHKEALESATQLLRLEPGLTVENYLKNHPAAEYSTGRTWAKALERAGVPAH